MTATATYTNALTVPIISGKRRGSVNRPFPGELRDKTVAEIEQAARGKGQAAARAKKALKLLKDTRWDK